MAGHAEVKNYFVQAVPVLSKYIELSDGHEVKSRLRLVSNQRCLSKSYLDKTKDIARFDDPVYYLGHIPNSVVAPRYLGLKDALKDFWGDMVQYSGEPPMFTPTRYDIHVYLQNVSRMANRAPYQLSSAGYPRLRQRKCERPFYGL